MTTVLDPTHEPHPSPGAETRLRRHPDPLATSFHEAGHAVAALRHGLDLRSVDVVYSPGRRFGACDFDHDHAPREVRALCLLAAGAAERKFTGSHRAHDAGDLDQLRVLFQGSALDPDRPPADRSSPDVDAERQRIVDAWHLQAEEFVAKEWTWITRVAQALQRRERLSGADVKKLCSHPVVHVDPPPTVDEGASLAVSPTPTVAPDPAPVTTIADTGHGGATKYDSVLFAAAHQRFLFESKSLTDADLALFALVDPGLAERARATRAGFVKAETEEERNAAKLPVTYKDFFGWLVDCLGPTLAAYRYKSREVAARLDVQGQRIDALEQRNAALETELRDRVKAVESRPAVHYAGAWHSDGGNYSEGALLTHRGGLWLAETTTSGAPGAQGASGWRLIVKSGGA